MTENDPNKQAFDFDQPDKLTISIAATGVLLMVFGAVYIWQQIAKLVG